MVSKLKIKTGRRTQKTQGSVTAAAYYKYVLELLAFRCIEAVLLNTLWYL